MSVIHGSGKPKIYARTNDFPLAVAVTTATATAIRLNTTESFVDLDADYGLLNRVIYVEDTTGAETIGKVISYDNLTKELVTDGWNKGTPKVGAIARLKDFKLDLPFCQELLEWFEPDVLSVKLQSGTYYNKKKGFYYRAILDYSNFLDGEILESLGCLFRTDFYWAEFFPRADNYKVSYKVDIDPSSSLSFAQTYNHQGHKYVKIALNGLERLSATRLKRLTSDETIDSRDDWGYIN